MKILVIDFQSSFEQHLPFNLEILNIINNKSNVCFIGQKSHCETLSTFFLNISFKYLKNLNSNFFLRFFDFLFFYLKYFCKIKKFDKIIILSAPLLYYSLLPILVFSNKKILFFQHGILENLNSKNFLLRNYIKICLLFYSKNKYFKLIFLSDHIKHALDKLHICTSNFTFIRHPYTFSLNLSKKNIIATIGIQSFKKGFKDNLYIHNCLNKFKIENIILGSVNLEVLDYIIKNNININLSSNFIPKSYYDKMLEEINIVYFTYPADQYNFTSSGAYFDAISKKCLVVAYHDNVFFQNESKNNKNLFLVRNKDEMVTKLIELNNDYNKYIQNFLNYDSKILSQLIN